MKNLWNQLGLALAGLALLIAPAARAFAQDDAMLKPAVVIAVASTDEQMADIAYLSSAANAPELGLVTFMAAQYTSELDATKPAGGYLTFVDSEPKFVGFAPVKNLDSLIAKFKKQIGEPEDAGDGVKKFTAPDGKEMFVKAQGGWVFVSDEVENLDNVPSDPAKLLGGLEAKYNVAARVSVQNIPADLRDVAISEMRKGLEENLQQQLKEQDPESREASEKLAQSLVRSLVELIEDTDEFTIGWAIDEMTKSTYLDVSITAVEGSKLAARAALQQDTKSEFAGFLLPDAAATLNFVGKLTDDDKELYALMLKSLRESALKELDDDDDLDGMERAAAKRVVGTLLDVVEQTVDDGTLDGGASLVLGPKELTFVAGGRVADGAALDKAFKDIVELAQDEPEFPDVKLDVEKHGDVSFHTLSMDIPADEDDARKILGDKLEAAIGIGQTSVYVAVGKDCIATLKSVIDSSAAKADEVVPPVQLNIALAPIMEFINSVDANPITAILLDTAKKAKGDDHVRITGKPIERGSTTRIEIEEGVLQLVTQGIKSALSGFGGADF